MSPFQVAAASSPSGLRTPIPVTTTLLSVFDIIINDVETIGPFIT
jgi:hypothetical protein